MRQTVCGWQLPEEAFCNGNPSSQDTRATEPDSQYLVMVSPLQVNGGRPRA